MQTTTTIHTTTSASIREKFLKGFSLYAIADILITLRGLILMPILTKVLGTVSYGIWSQIGTSVNMVASLGNMGISSAMYRYLPGLPHEQFRREFWMGITSIMGGIVLFALPFFIFAKPIASAFFGGEENRIYVSLGGILMITNTLHVCLMLYFRIVLQMKPYTALMLIQAVLSTVAYAWAAISGGKLLIVAVTAVVVNVFLCLLSLGLVGYRLGFTWPDFGPFRKYMALGLPMMPIGFMNWALNSADRFMVAYYLGIVEVGIYGVSYKLASLSIMIVARPIWAMAPGSLNALWNTGKKEEALALVRQIFKYSYILTVPIACVLIFWGKFILIKLTTADFALGFTIIPWVVVGYAFEYTSSYYRVIFTWFEKTKIFLGIFPFAVVMNLALNFVLIPRMGILGAAIATTATYSILLTIEIIISRRYLRPKFPIVKSLTAVAIWTGLAYTISRLPHENWSTFLSHVFAFGILYLAGCWIFRLITKSEVLHVVKMLRGAKDASY